MVVDVVTRLAHALEARRRRELAPEDRTPAAVLVPLLVSATGVHVLFTRRVGTLPHHGGQVAFPGGIVDLGRDTDRTATALREAHEEIGIVPTEVRVLGVLDDIATVTSRFVITPVVGLVPYGYPWRPCAREVDRIFTVAVSELHAPAAQRRETWEFDGRSVHIDAFTVAGQVIWGATHRITRNLLDVLGEPY